ncbi:MAG TPA: bifunctional riboflavin kinase/FAD synthetase [Vicinamibacterales bacterium]|nr:bifunctional riboflavin kinase/FAD synthetase [Vicinamibacterales bacterium]
MQVVHFPESPRPKWPQPIAALGNFDGLHRGHLKLLERVRREAGERGGTPVAMTFDPHPPRVLRPDKAPPLLMTLDQKLEGFERAGMQGVAIVRFTADLSRWEPEVFVETVLVDWLRVAEVCVGANFLFGRDRSGTFTLLRAIGEHCGFRTEKIDPIRYKDFVVSSTRVRHLVAEGRVDEAGALLGHHYFLDGTVVTGDGRGRTLGFPTANLATTNELLPAFGIYATIAIIDGVHHRSVTSVGVRPTIGDGRVTVETYLLEGSPDLYGARVRLAFVQWLREERKFDGLEPLRVQMADDCAQAAALFRQIAV